MCFVLFLVCLYICVCECLHQNINHKTKHANNTNCGSTFEPGASRLPYYCASICVRSWCNWRASSVDSKTKQPKKKMVLGKFALVGVMSILHWVQKHPELWRQYPIPASFAPAPRLRRRLAHIRRVGLYNTATGWTGSFRFLIGIIIDDKRRRTLFAISAEGSADNQQKHCT